jgi:hypothetical protein
MSETPVRFLRAQGTPDGMKTDFETVQPYQVGTLRVLVNGIFRKDDLGNGYLETDPGTGEFEMKIAPKAGDTLWTFYREAF